MKERERAVWMESDRKEREGVGYFFGKFTSISKRD